MNVELENRAVPAVEPPFVSQDNLALDQLRLENLWLRQRLHALSKVEEDWRRARRRGRVDERRLAA